jgi:hypothetical protein
MRKGNRMRYRLIIFLLGTLLFVVANEANADIGVPMIFITLPGMLIALIPAILIETYVLSKQLTLTLKSSAKATIWGNVVSTIIGIPVAWFVLVVIQVVTGGGRAYGLGKPAKEVSRGNVAGSLANPI